MCTAGMSTNSSQRSCDLPAELSALGVGAQLSAHQLLSDPFQVQERRPGQGLAAARTPWWYPLECDLLALAAFECLGGEPLVAAAAAGLGDAVACRLVVATAVPAAALRMPTDPRHLRRRTVRQRVTSALSLQAEDERLARTFPKKVQSVMAVGPTSASWPSTPLKIGPVIAAQFVKLPPS